MGPYSQRVFCVFGGAALTCSICTKWEQQLSNWGLNPTDISKLKIAFTIWCLNLGGNRESSNNFTIKFCMGFCTFTDVLPFILHDYQVSFFLTPALYIFCWESFQTLDSVMGLDSVVVRMPPFMWVMWVQVPCMKGTTSIEGPQARPPYPIGLPV